MSDWYTSTGSTLILHARYKLGDSFVYVSLEKAQSQIEADSSALDAAIEQLKSKADDCEKNMSELKVHLKNKFKVCGL